MREGGYTALEAAGLVIAALAAQTVIHGLLDRDSEVLWGILNWVPGGLTEQADPPRMHRARRNGGRWLGTHPPETEHRAGR